MQLKKEQQQVFQQELWWLLKAKQLFWLLSAMDKPMPISKELLMDKDLFVL